MSVLSRLALAICCALSLAACNKGGGGDSAPTVQTYLVKGDPALVFAGATLNSQSPFTDETIEELNDFSMISATTFVEREKPKSDKNVDIEKENAPRDGTAKRPEFRLSVTRDDSNSYTLKINDWDLLLLFKREPDGTLQIKKASSKGQTIDVNALHWSRSKDQKYVSVLLSDRDPVAGKEITALYFGKRTAADTKPTLSKRFNFLVGPGAGLSWDQTEDLQIDLCGVEAETQKWTDAVDKWRKPLAGRLNLKTNYKQNFAPFSDLNQHCVFFVNTYISELRPKIINYGITIPVLSIENGRIIDSDILIFRSEFEKLRSLSIQNGKSPETVKTLIESEMAETLAHELGHLLGLAHMFDGTPSIMAYKRKNAELQAYDEQAIQELYPLMSKNAVVKAP